MKKKEFMNELRFQIRKFDKAEKKEILDYYDELIDDRLDEEEDEAAVIRSLGSVKSIVRTLVEERAGNKTDGDSGWRKKRKSISGAKLVALIVTFPLWLLAVSLIFVLLLAAVAAILGSALAGISVAAGGLYWCIGSAMQFTVSATRGFIQLGAGLILIALGLVLAYYLGKLFILAAKGSCKLGGTVIKNGGILIYE